MRIALKRQPDVLSVAIDDQMISVPVSRNSRARRIILKIDPRTGGPALTLPDGVSLGQGRAFLTSHTEWIAARLNRQPAGAAFADGAIVPFRGDPHHIRHCTGRGLVHIRGDAKATIVVPGDTAHLSRRLHAWLKRQARADLEQAVLAHTHALGVKHRGLRIGDATSRWGSCSGRGTLSFSWRLILAPPVILNYLAAHEVAHLKEMNHGPKFWKIVAQVDTGHESARKWLKTKGPALHAVGRDGGLIIAAGADHSLEDGAV
ncbi:MAG: M48 family metallopeptidase [Alphaproteobacteria bacterium]